MISFRRRIIDGSKLLSVSIALAGFGFSFPSGYSRYLLIFSSVLFFIMAIGIYLIKKEF